MIPTKNILVITYWSFSDALIQTYTLPYLKIISAILPPNSKIYLVTLEKENYGDVIPVTSDKIINIRYQYSNFGSSAIFSWIKNIISLRKMIRKNNIDFIHAFCTPAGMIGYILSVITNKPLILDSYEPHAEAMVENGEWKKNSLSFKLLFYFEKKQTQRASQIIATTEGMYDYAIKKYNTIKNPSNFFVKPACVDIDKFNPIYKKDALLLQELNLQNKIVCVYAGKFGGIYLKEEVFEFYQTCYKYWKDDFVALILTNHPVAEIEALIEKFALPKSAFRVIFVPHAQIHKYIGLGDFAITPVKPVNTKKYCTPIKDGEYWAMGLPVIITKNISIDSDVIEANNIGYVLNELNKSEYLLAIKKIATLINDQTVSAKIRMIAENKRNYSIANAIYKSIYA